MPGNKKALSETAKFATGCFVVSGGGTAVILAAAQRPDILAVLWFGGALVLVPLWLVHLTGRRPWALNGIMAVVLGSVATAGLAYVGFGAMLMWDGYSPYGGLAGQANREGKSVSITGMIDSNAYAQLENIFASSDATGIDRVSLNSGGGDIAVARRIGDLIASREIRVDVTSGSRCESACTTIFAKSKARFASAEAKFMFHGSAEAVGLPFMNRFQFNSDRPSSREDLIRFKALSEKLAERRAFESTDRVDFTGLELFNIDPTFLNLL